MNIYKDCAWIKQGSPLIIAVDFDDTLVEAGDKFPEIKRPTKLMTQLVELKNNPLYHIQLILWLRKAPVNEINRRAYPFAVSLRQVIYFFQFSKNRIQITHTARQEAGVLFLPC